MKRGGVVTITLLVSVLSMCLFYLFACCVVCNLCVGC